VDRETLKTRPRTRKIYILADQIRSGKVMKGKIIEGINGWVNKIESHHGQYSNYPRKELLALSNLVLYKLLEVSLLVDQFKKKDWPELHNAFEQFKKSSGSLANYLITTRVASLN
jgi:hypothetical protein